jgi:hypothetical protein
LRLEQIERALSGYDNNILLIFEYLKQLEQAKQQELDQNQRKRIGFKQESEV